MLERNVDAPQMVNEKENSVVVEAIEDETPPMQQKLKGCSMEEVKDVQPQDFEGSNDEMEIWNLVDIENVGRGGASNIHEALG